MGVIRSYTIRDDGRYTVVVGWDDERATFFAHVYDGATDAGPVVSMGRLPREISLISQLGELISPYASLDTTTISELRHDAGPLG